MHDVPRQLSLAELVELFEGDTTLVRVLAERDDPLGEAREVARTLTDEEKIEALAAHPAIGAKKLSPRSAREQGTDDEPAVLTELAYLNQVYEEKFGFRFVVFVNRRPKSAILEVLRERLQHTVEEELETAIDELISIAEDRSRTA